VTSCNNATCLTFELEFTNPVGFNNSSASTAIQVAYAFAQIIDADDDNGDNGDDGDDARCGVRRRLRVWTAVSRSTLCECIFEFNLL
jgi:hypothetical protein